jgi:serine protease Do
MRYSILIPMLSVGSLFSQPLASPTPWPDPQVNTKIFRTAMVGGSYLGVGVREIESAEQVKALKLKEEMGVEVTHVEDDSPAAAAGLKTGDVILQYNGQKVDGIEQFSRFVRETPPGREVRLSISRDGNVQTLTAKVAARKMASFPTMVTPMPMPMPNVEIPEMPRTLMMWNTPLLGIEGESLKGQLADFFGVKEGVLVRAVTKDSPAAKAGIKAGDVIVRVNDAKVVSTNEISSSLRSLKGKTSVPVVIIRDHKEMTLTANIEPGRSGSWGDSPFRVVNGTRSIRM